MESEHQYCPHCGEMGIDFDWVDGIPEWKCKCGMRFKDTRWPDEQAG